ncbi:MAG: type VI secretion system baseplate subunit TssK [Phycisphaerae bacterium]
MASWRPLHWYEGMFLRPHHFQYERRYVETVLRQQFELARPFAWGAVELNVSSDALANCILRLDECLLRLKDGTWARIPDNTAVEPLNFQLALDAERGPLDLLFGVPVYEAVRPNAISVTQPQSIDGNPRFDPIPGHLRDENTGDNEQRTLMRRLRGRLFHGREDTTGYDVIRIGAVRRSDKPGAPPEFDPDLIGPQLAVQANAELTRVFNRVLDQIDANGKTLAGEALETQMSFGDGVSANTEHLMKLHILNGIRTRLRGLCSRPALHPHDLYIEFAAVAGDLSIFDSTLLEPEPVPAYDHDYPARALFLLRDRIETLLETLKPKLYARVPFTRTTNAEGREGLAVELRPSWIVDQCEMYITLESNEFELADKLLNHVYSRFDMKLASPTLAPKLDAVAVFGLKLEARAPRAGTLPRRPGVHYYWIDKQRGSGYEDYWLSCEQERGIWLTVREGQRAELEEFKPALVVLLKKKGGS